MKLLRKFGSLGVISIFGVENQRSHGAGLFQGALDFRGESFFQLGVSVYPGIKGNQNRRFAVFHIPAGFVCGNSSGQSGFHALLFQINAAEGVFRIVVQKANVFYHSAFGYGVFDSGVYVHGERSHRSAAAGDAQGDTGADNQRKAGRRHAPFGEAVIFLYGYIFFRVCN